MVLAEQAVRVVLMLLAINEHVDHTLAVNRLYECENLVAYLCDLLVIFDRDMQRADLFDWLDFLVSVWGGI